MVGAAGGSSSWAQGPNIRKKKIARSKGGRTRRPGGKKIKKQKIQKIRGGGIGARVGHHVTSRETGVHTKTKK